MLAGGLQVAAVTAVGALLGWLVAGSIGTVIAAVFSLLMAVSYGRAIVECRPYERGARGVGLCILDATWSSLNTWAGALFLAVLRWRGNQPEVERSAGSASLFLRDRAIAGYATTIGIVKAGCPPRLERHEQIHVFQARLLGPLYLPLVAMGFVVATLVPYWLLIRVDQRRPVDGLASYFNGVYRHAWHEWWAYRRA